MAFQSAAIVRNPRRQQEASTKSIPACVGGWNDRDPISNMPEADAVILNNFFCLPSKVIVRKGFSNWVTGIGNQVESLMPYEPQSGTSALFAAAGTSFYNVKTSGAVGAAVVTGLTNARWQSVNMATSGGNFLMAVNGADKLRGWNGAAWWTDGDGTHDITGVNTATCTSLTLFKRRLWLVQGNTSKVWYLPVDSIAGAASSIDFGPIWTSGGKLIAMADWSIDAGIGIDDYAAFISDKGEIALYKGSDPSSATTWALVGVFAVGSPIGTRCTTSYKGDVLMICKDGLLPLSQALQSARVDTSIALTDKIQNTVSASTSAYGTSFGWQIQVFPGENMVIVNVPVSVGNQQQYVMNTISGAWSKWTGLAANTFTLFGDDLYFGANGVVCKAWTTQADAGSNINFQALGAFNYFGDRDSLKEWTLARPVMALDNNVGLLYGLNTDFDQTAPTGVPSFSSNSSGLWGTGRWGTAKWGAAAVIQKAWQHASGFGYCAAPHLVGATNAGRVEWYSTDLAYKRGGII